MRGDDSIYYFVELRAVGDLLEAASFYELVNVATLLPKLGEETLGNFAGYGAIADALDELRELRGLDGAGTDAEVVFVEQGVEFDQYPVGGELGLGGDYSEHGLEVVGDVDIAAQEVGVVGAEPELAYVALAAGFGELGHGGFDLLDALAADDYGQEVGIREVAVIVGFFFAAHGARLVGFGVVEAGFLLDAAAVFDYGDLPSDFEGDSFFHKAVRVDVLDLAARTELAAAALAHRDIGVATHRALRHVAVRDVEIAHEGVDLFQIGYGLGAAAQFGLGDYLNQGRARAVEVDAAQALEFFVQRFAGVFFEVRSGYADNLLTAVFQVDAEFAFADYGQLHLADLVAFGQIRIKVVLAREDRGRANFSFQR